MFSISGYVGGVHLKACMGALNFVNPDGITKLNNGVVELNNTRLNFFVQVCFVCFVKVGFSQSPFYKNDFV